MKYVSGPYAQAQLINNINNAEMKLTERYERDGVITDVAEQKKWRELIQDVSFGRNTVMYDDQGSPSIMVVVPLIRGVDALAGASQNAHPAFIVNGALKSKLYISKYQNITAGSGATLRALSLRGMNPKSNINFDDALLASKQKGAGWHLMTNAEWAAIVLQCKAKGFMPRGNNNYGVDASVASEAGVMSYYDTTASKTGKVLTGSGPVAWTHDGSPFGIYDLNGNVNEWVGGLRLNNGEIQILQDNNAADNTKDQSASSTEWKAILAADGSLVAPGTAGTLKYDNTSAGDSTATAHDVGGDPQLNTIINNQMYIPGGQVDYGYSTVTFETLTGASGVTVPNVAKFLGLAPVDSAHGSDNLFVRNYAERVPARGGYWNGGLGAGVFYLNLYCGRSFAYNNLGFRTAFVL